ncbi:MAG: hypothetical protein WBN44_07455 [Woeseiaceae bacterium]
MAWDVFDFAVFGGMLLVIATAYRLATRHTGNTTYRIAVAVALAAAFLLIWVNGAVGIIGDPSSDANLMHFGVLAVGMAGAILGHFQPHGMARALYSMALAQVAVAVIALAAGLGSTAPKWPQDVLVLTAFFVALWLTSAWLFRKSALAQSDA